MKEDDLIRNINPFGLRLQPSLKAKVEEAAKKNRRSLNAEIAARLEESFQRPAAQSEPLDREQTAALVQEMQRLIDQAARNLAAKDK